MNLRRATAAPVGDSCARIQHVHRQTCSRLISVLEWFASFSHRDDSNHGGSSAPGLCFDWCCLSAEALIESLTAVVSNRRRECRTSRGRGGLLVFPLVSPTLCYILPQRACRGPTGSLEVVRPLLILHRLNHNHIFFKHGKEYDQFDAVSL